MRYRRLTSDGDMTFGQGTQDFLVNSPETVSQAVMTRLRLLTGEWFLDVEEGTPYSTQVLGKYTSSTYDQALRDRIAGTEGVIEILQYTSVLTGRQLSVDARIDTVYGVAQVTGVL